MILIYKKVGLILLNSALEVVFTAILNVE